MNEQLTAAEPEELLETTEQESETPMAPAEEQPEALPEPVEAETIEPETVEPEENTQPPAGKLTAEEPAEAPCGDDADDPALEKKEKWKTVCISVMLVLAIVLCATVVSQVLSQGYVSLGGFSLFRVVTGSMEPEIPVGSLLISRETDIEDIQVNDIVNYKSRESGMFGVVITHRVIAVHKMDDGTTYLETKGDANQYVDVMFVDEQALIGRVIYYTKEGNLIAALFTFLTSSVGFLACIVVPCLVLGVATIQECIKSLRAELDDMNRQLKNVEAQKSRDVELTPEEYEQLYSRLREEVLEELRKSVEAQTE